MKIGIFTDAYFPQVNGVVTSVDETVRELRKRRHEVFIVTASYPNYKDKEENVIRLSSVMLNKKLNIRVATHLPEKALINLYKIDFDLIHGHGGGTVSLLGVEIAKIRKIPFVFTYHTLFSKYAHYILKGFVVRPKIIEALSRIFCNRCDVVIAPTPKIKDILLSYGVKKSIEVIPTGLDTKKFSKAQKGYLRKKFKMKNTDKILLSVGRLGKEKSIDFLINSFKTISEENKDTVFVIVGEGGERQNLQDLVRQLDLENKVYFLGNIDIKYMPQVYKDADIFLFSSTTETQGLVILEAMLAGLPIVAVNDAVISSIVKNNESGILSKNSSEDFSKKIIKLLNDGSLRKRISRNAHTDAQKLSITKTTDLLEKLYIKFLKIPRIHSPRLISVVIPAYNEEMYIENCLNSIKKQDYKGMMEIIVVDNNSTDKTVEIAKKFGAKIIVEKKQGYVFALKRGMDEAKGEVIAVTDADTQVSLDWMSTIRRIFSKPRVVAVTGTIDLKTKSKLVDISMSALYATFLHVSSLIGRPNLSGFNFAVRKDAFVKAGGLNTLFEMSPDVDLGLRLAKLEKVETVNDLRVIASFRRFERRFTRSLWEYAKGYIYSAWFRKPAKVKQKPIR
jgi:1,2-diacylglycerol 3-alpha-glucosyltransferase